MADERYIVAIDFDVADLKGKVSTALSGASTGGGALVGGKLALAVDAGGKIGGLTGKLEALGRSAGDALMRVGDAFTGAVEQAGSLAAAFGTIGAGAAIAGLTYGVTSLNSEIEKTQIGFADILTANGVTSTLEEGLGKSALLMAQIRRDAAALPGETPDLARIFKLASIPGLAAGASTDRVERVSANAMAFGMGVANLDSGTVARELSSLISGRAGAHNILGANLGLMGDDAQSFNRLAGADRFKKLEDLLAKHEGSIALFGDSFEGLSSTLRDNAKLFLTSATGPLFERVKQALRDANGWFDQNRSSVLKWGDLLGHQFANAFDFGRRQLEQWLPSIESFAREADERIGRIWTKVGPLIEAVSDKASRILGDPATFDRIADVLKLYAAVKVGQFAAPSVGAAAGLGKSAMGLLGAGGGGGIGALEESAGALASPEGLMVVGVSMAALLPVALGIAGAFDDLTNSSSLFHDKAAKEIEAALKSADDAFLELRHAGEDLRPVVDWMGENLTNALANVAKGADDAAQTIRLLTGGFVSLAEWLGLKQEDNGLTTKGVSKAKGYAKFEPDELSDATKSAQKRDEQAKRAPTVGVQNNYFSVATNADPSRIVRSIESVIAEKSRFPTASSRVPNYTRDRRR
jgi:hypothetical protein